MELTIQDFNNLLLFKRAPAKDTLITWFLISGISGHAFQLLARGLASSIVFGRRKEFDVNELAHVW